jgi:cytochrome P450
VYWQDIARQAGYWAVLTHADCVQVAKHPTLFSAEVGGVVLDTLPPPMLEMMRGQLLAMDPPRHLDFRRPLAPHFKARVIAGLEEQIREVCRGVMVRARDEGELDFVSLTSTLPSQVVGVLMGLPAEDWSRIHHLAQRITSGDDPDINPDGPGYGDGGSNASRQMAEYAMAFAARRRNEEPKPDLTSVLLDTDFGGRRLDDVAFGMFFVQLVTAGNDTTRTLLSSGLLLLLQHPDQLAELRADVSLTPLAVEEMLRVENPLHYFRRTATADTRLGDVAIAAGDKVAMYYTSANRDERVFADAQRFDLRRNPNPHLSFGIAEHFCLGVHLARLEARVFFEELLGTFADIELTDEPKRTRSNLNNALKSMPVRLR